jgi:hypothetical protein
VERLGHEDCPLHVEDTCIGCPLKDRAGVLVMF